MANSFRMLIRDLGVAVLRKLGTTIRDQRTGEAIGKALIFGWRGRIVVIGLDYEPPVHPHFLPQDRLTYWKQEIGLSTYPPIDAPRATSPHDAECHPDSSAAQ